MKNSFYKKISLGVVLFLLLIAFIFSPENSSPKELERMNFDFSAVISNKQLKPETEEQFINPFEQLDIAAKSVIVWDIKHQKSFFERNADEVLPLASIIKMVLALTAYESIPPNTEINIEREFLEAEGDTGLYLDERWLAKDLIEFSLIASSNDGAKAIASVAGAINTGLNSYKIGREFFIEKMRSKAREMGLKTISIENESGLDQDEFQSGALGSARDLAKLFENLFSDYPELIEPTSLGQASFKSLSKINHKVDNTNVILNETPGVIGSKTGFTPLAGGNLAMIFDADLGRPIIVVVLGSTFDERFSDSKKLVEASREYVRKTKPATINNISDSL